MERRNALKTISLGMGVTLSVGSFTLFLQGCKNDPKPTVDVGIFGSTDHQQLVRQLIDAILPSTDLPAASEVGVLNYINGIVKEVYDEQARTTFVKGLNLTAEHIRATLGKDSSQLDDERITSYLESLMGATADASLYTKMLNITRQPIDEVSADDIDDYHRYSFLHALKAMTINGYCQSEYIGEEILQYVPAPGPYNGHLEYTGEKVYSLS